MFLGVHSADVNTKSNAVENMWIFTGDQLHFFVLWCLTLSPPILLRLYTLPYWSNPPFLIFDIRALWRSGLSARAPECEKIKNGGLDQYGAEPLEQQQFKRAGIEGVNKQVQFY